MTHETSHSPSPDLVSRLTLTTLFTALDESALQAVAAELEWVHLPGGETLFRQGETGDCLYIVLSGRLRTIVTHDDGSEDIVGEVGRGESVGEMAILTGELRSATIRAIRDTELVRLSQAGFDRLVEKHPRTMRSLARTVILRLQERIHLSARVNTLATIAVAPTGPDVPLSDFAHRLAVAFAAIGPTLHLQSNTLDRALGKGAAQTPHDHAKNSTIVAWLNEQEAKYQFVIYQTDPISSPWTSRCIRQADRLLLIARADTKPTPDKIERQLSHVYAHKTAARTDLVLIHSDQLRQPVGTHEWLASQRVTTHHHARLRSAEDFARLARFLTGRAVGLVLSGGGARGFAHIGVIRALTEAEIPIDLIGGASMGAVIAAQHASGWDYGTMLDLNRKGWINSRPLADYTIPVVSLIGGGKILQMLTMMFGDTKIEDLWLSYFCVSSNLTRAEVMVHREGLLQKWVGASIAVPGIGPPLLDRGNLLVDGGVLNNLPVDVMHSLGAGPIIAVDVSPQIDATMTASSPRDLSAWSLLWSRINPLAEKLTVPSIFEILLRTTTLSSAHSAKRMKEHVDLYLRPPVEHFGKFEWKALNLIVTAGYQYAQQRITEWKFPVQNSRPWDR